MKTNAAILWEYGGNWDVEEIDLDPPQDGEVLVSWEATGLCHSDEHIRTGDLPAPLPLVAATKAPESCRRSGRVCRASSRATT